MTKLEFIAEPGRQEITSTCFFDAPREPVFKANTDPELIPHWWGPRRLTTFVERLELRKGGVWRFIQYDAEGNEYAFNGVYHEILPPERLIYTFEFEGFPGHVMLETVMFEEQDGKTKLTDKVVYQSVEDRDGMLNSGMEAGASESMDRLAELLVEDSPAQDLGSVGGGSFDLGKIILPLFLGISLLMLSIAVIAGVITGRAIASERRVLGRVVDLEVRMDQYGNEFYYPVVEFSLPDNSRTRFTTAEGSWPPAYENGARVTVRYDPGPPLRARISSLSGNIGLWTVTIITGVLALAFAAATVFAWWVLKDETAENLET